MKKIENEQSDGSNPSKASADQQASPVSDFEHQQNDGWIEHSDGEVVKLEIGDSIEGELISKNISHKYNDCGIYKIMVDDDPIPKVILGSRQLDRTMESIETNQRIRIFFEGTKPTDKGNSMKVFRVFTQGKH